MPLVHRRFTVTNEQWYLLFQACLVCVSLGTVGMSSSISSRVGILFSLLPAPAFAAAARALAPPSRWEWRIPRDTLPPMAPDFLEDLSLAVPSLLSLSWSPSCSLLPLLPILILFLVLVADDRRFKELLADEETEVEDVESVTLMRLDLKNKKD